jgi:hypothetical protein
MRITGSRKTTKYEMALRGPAGVFCHLGWTDRKTKHALWLAMLNHGPEITARVPLPESTDEFFEWNPKAKAWEWNRFSIAFTGATAICFRSPLPFAFEEDAEKWADENDPEL